MSTKSTDSTHLEALGVLTAYIKAFREVPHDADTLIEYSSTISDGQHTLNHSAAQKIIQHYTRNLHDYRAGKVGYCARTRTVSYSNPNSPASPNKYDDTVLSYPNLMNAQKQNISPSIVTNLSNQTADDNNSEINILPQYNNSHSNSSIDSVKSVQSLSEEEEDKEDNMSDVGSHHSTVSTSYTPEIDDVDVLAVINTEPPPKKINKASSHKKKKQKKLKRNKKIPKRYRKKKKRKEDDSCVWETIWNMIVNPDCTCSK